MTIRNRLYQMISPSNSTEINNPRPSSSTSNSRYNHRASLVGSLSSTLNSGSNGGVNGNIIPTSPPADYHIVLVDIKQTVKERKIECVKKILDQPGLRYAAISYRWGEVPEQAVLTPSYVAHITSFALSDLELLCGQLLVSNEEKVDYIWVDAISIDQQNEKARKATIRQMNNIYRHATMILAIPDLHIAYLKRDPSSKAALARIRKHTPRMYNHVSGICQPTRVVPPSDHHHIHDFPHIATFISSQFSSSSPTSSIPPDSPSTPLTPVTPDTPERLQQQRQQQQTQCDCYQQENGASYAEAIDYLQYLINDWSNRVWVISEYHIGRTKNMKLWFLSFDIQWYYSTRPRFIPLFDCAYHDQFRHRRFLDMMFNSAATKNEDRFYAVLPLSDQYKDCIETQDTVSQWNITDMTSVCLRLYAFVGIREKAAILYSCSKGKTLILPSFASCCSGDAISKILELDRHQLLLESLILMTPIIDRYRNSKYAIEDKETANGNGSFYRLVRRHDHPQQSYHERAFLKIKVKCHRLLSTSNKDTKMFFHQHASICEQLGFADEQKEQQQQNHHHHLYHHHRSYHLDQVFIPFIESGTRSPIGVQLVGNRKLNRWVLYQLTIINVNVPAADWKLVEEVEEFHIY
ncbi:uncharacterized protein BX664DRAFT_332046 [Halteromyces radiatus]|uniref:uncharacterized protein n=1 Tax=Halteromyces radiatus TaxID=101107 RepID=UPI00221E5A40|nr:uncharacterized protein BX664DRAFT_332046 [Halteromyces radiatus]KAI8089048.1 hypothetical protein BX664DRAFT_332046 [Halteromyces radiatus]